MQVHLLDGKGNYIKKDHRRNFIFSMQECLDYLRDQARIEKFHLLEHMLSLAQYSLHHPQDHMPYTSGRSLRNRPDADGKKKEKVKKKKKAR